MALANFAATKRAAYPESYGADVSSKLNAFLLKQTRFTTNIAIARPFAGLFVT